MVVRYVEAVRDGDAAVIRDSFAADAVWHYPGSLPISGEWRGRARIVDDFLGGMGRRLQSGAPLLVELTGILAEGPRVVATWTSRGTAASGAPYDNQCLGIFEVRDGRIVSVREYTDTDHVARVLFA
ncbi:ketosteroid isomerase-like protein [Frankia sp. CpI1-P]|uniref:nuclear transport factor 2 family protein n=1 Tax=Frankia sp. CpI1-P TaxID=1502734 RepID=UPI0005D11972|nr:limonene-1,2-epoxide hydrolase [Frankia sp. ACN1ag]KQM07827.1 ketosteroid isomerase-like protein [Frankia sp. CpI1-P]